MSEIVESEKLKQIIGKIENIEAERQEISDQLKDTYNEAKTLGFDVKIIKHVLKLKQKDKNQLAEEETLIDLYRGALGI
jgi:uncharacterized protein (UPF0335 family)